MGVLELLGFILIALAGGLLLAKRITVLIAVVAAAIGLILILVDSGARLGL
jgi:hypothetical protein